MLGSWLADVRANLTRPANCSIRPNLEQNGYSNESNESNKNTDSANGIMQGGEIATLNPVWSKPCSLYELQTRQLQAIYFAPDIRYTDTEAVFGHTRAVPGRSAHLCLSSSR